MGAGNDEEESESMDTDIYPDDGIIGDYIRGNLRCEGML